MYNLTKTGAVVLLACFTSSAFAQDNALNLVVNTPNLETNAADLVETINGFIPPGVLEPLHDVEVMIDTTQADKKQLRVTRGTRKAGTRVAIHIHEYGGHTCVLSGAITDFVEGKAPQYFPAGTCYYMPPNTPMTAVNLGTEDAVLIDTFVLPKGADPMIVLELGYAASAHD